MDEISKLRLEIDQIQKELAGTFLRRLQVSKKIWEIKKRSQLDFIDPDRELQIEKQISDLVQELSCDAERQALRNLLQVALEESKTCLKARFK